MNVPSTAQRDDTGRLRLKVAGGLVGVLALSAAAAVALWFGCRQGGPEAPPAGEAPARLEQFVRAPAVLANETTSLSHTFTVRNDAGRPVRFVEVAPACACSAAELAKRELEPGEETTLRLDVRLLGRTGEQRFSCALVDDAGARWVYGIEITIHLPAGFAERTVTFGMVDPKAAATLRSEFLILSHRPLGGKPPVLVTSDSEEMEATAVIDQAVADVLADGIHRTRVPVELRLSAPAAAGAGRGTVRARLGGGAGQEWAQEVTWHVRSAYVVEPREASFWSVDPAEGPRTVRVRLARADGKPLTIKALRVKGKVVEVAAKSAAASAAQELEFTLHPRGLAGPFWGEAEVETDHPVQPLVKIPIACVPRTK